MMNFTLYYKEKDDFLCFFINLLKIKDIDVQLQDITVPYEGKQVTLINMEDKYPALVTDTLLLVDWYSIIEFVMEKKPFPQIVPSDLDKRAITRSLVSFIINTWYNLPDLRSSVKLKEYIDLMLDLSSGEDSEHNSLLILALSPFETRVRNPKLTALLDTLQIERSTVHQEPPRLLTSIL